MSEYEILAIRYAHNAERRTAENFLGGDPHDGPMPMDFFVWVLKGGGQTIVIDTGFDANMAERRARKLTRPVAEGLKAAGIDRCRRQGRDPDPYALRSCRQPRSVPEREVSRSGPGDGILHRPLHVPFHPASSVRGGRRHRDGAKTVSGARHVPQRRERDRRRRVGSSGRRSFARAAVRAGADPARMGRGRLRRLALLREFRAVPAVPGRRRRQRDAGGLRRDAAAWRRRCPISCRATTRSCYNAIRRSRAGLRISSASTPSR